MTGLTMLLENYERLGKLEFQGVVSCYMGAEKQI